MSKASAKIEEIIHEGILYAIVIRSNYIKEGVSFFTPDNLSQQLAYMHHKPGKHIEPHFHNDVVRQVKFTQEVLVIKKGKIRVDFYTDDQTYLFSSILVEGDTILLAHGGHGFKVLEEVEMIEVKQGPYIGTKDKIRFAAVSPGQVKFRGVEDE